MGVVKYYHILETSSDTEEISNALKNCLDIIEQSQVENKPYIRMIGDELADRGANDLLILVILQKLHTHKVPYHILLSNHGISFLSLYLGWRQGTAGKSWLLAEIFISSFKALKQAIELKWFDDKILKNLIETCYLPYIKLVDYSLSPTENLISIYSHAAIGLNDLISLCDITNTVFRSHSREELAQFIDSVNQKFQKKILPNLCTKLMEISDIQDEEVAFEQLNVFSKSAIWKICWNRDYNLYRPKSLHNYSLCYIHGHDHQKDYGASKHYISLDGFLGKSAEDHHGELKEIKNNDVFLSQLPKKQIQPVTHHHFFSIKSFIFHPKVKPLLPYMGLMCLYFLFKFHAKNPKTIPGLLGLTLRLAIKYVPFFGKLISPELNRENSRLFM